MNKPMPEEIKRFLSEAAKKRWENKTPEERSAHGKHMIKKRWDKRKGKD